jgi:hypothetical protein
MYRAPGTITLVPGKPRTLPTDYDSAVRVRALAKADMFGPAADGQALLALEVTPEPKLLWQSLESVRVGKAVDDQGQKLTQVTEDPTPGAGAAVPPAVPRMPAIRPGLGGLAFSGGNSRYAVVRLKKGAQAARSLKELQGTLAARLLTEARPYITVDNVLKAAGKIVKGRDGGSIKVLAVAKDDNGQITIRFQVEQPPNVIPEAGHGNGGWGAPVPIRARPAPLKVPAALPPGAGAAPAAAPPPGAAAPAAAVRARLVIATFNGTSNGLSLRDDKGNVLPARLGVTLRAGAAGATAEYNLYYAPQKDKGKPAQLVFSGHKAVDVDSPFTLKDVPLP